MRFNIQFTSESSSWGELKINDCIEVFESSFEYWSRKQYENSWTEALKSAIRGEKSALIVWISNPLKQGCLDWWPLYLVKDTIYIQNAVCDLSEYVLDEKNLYQHILERNSGGGRVSEWSISVASVEEWLTTRC